MRGMIRIMIGLGMAGCAAAPQYVERVPVAAPDSDTPRGYDRPRPMPDQPGYFDREAAPHDVPPPPPPPAK